VLTAIASRLASFSSFLLLAQKKRSKEKGVSGELLPLEIYLRAGARCVTCVANATPTQLAFGSANPSLICYGSEGMPASSAVGGSVKSALEELPAIVGGASGSAICAANGKHGATSASRGFGVSQKSPQFFTHWSFSFPLSFGPAKERGNKSDPRCNRGEQKSFFEE